MIGPGQGFSDPSLWGLPAFGGIIFTLNGVISIDHPLPPHLISIHNPPLCPDPKTGISCSNFFIDSQFHPHYNRPVKKRVLIKQIKQRIREYFLSSDECLIGEYDSSGSEIRAYGTAPGSTRMTDPLFRKEGDNYYFYQNYHLGTAQKLINTSGRIAWSVTYDSFGNAQIGVEEIADNLRFPGQ